MPVNMGKQQTGPGWGCSCKSFRHGEPTPEQALKALARSASVTVFFNIDGRQELGVRTFTAWTNSENRYIVTYDPNKAGGFCKHVCACMIAWAPWHRKLALGASDALAEIKRLEKELKKRDREIAKLRG